jgi:hypothetical protein
MSEKTRDSLEKLSLDYEQLQRCKFGTPEWFRLLKKMGGVAGRHLPYVDLTSLNHLTIQFSAGLLDMIAVTIRLLQAGEIEQARPRLERLAYRCSVYLPKAESGDMHYANDFVPLRAKLDASDWLEVKEMLSRILIDFQERAVKFPHRLTSPQPLL